MSVDAVSNNYVNNSRTVINNGQTTVVAEQKEVVQSKVDGVGAVRGNSPAVIYEKHKEDSAEKEGYSKNKMSAGERALLVDRLKEEQQKRKEQLVELVNKMVSRQADAYGKAKGLKQYLQDHLDQVDEKTRLQAQQDISEDGYYGVKQTAQRLFDFASALAGDDVENMKKMQAAMEKGYKQAEKKWGGSLPGICQSTLEAANKMFEDYYELKGVKSDS